jgi:hypothetical protein
MFYTPLFTWLTFKQAYIIVDNQNYVDIEVESIKLKVYHQGSQVGEVNDGGFSFPKREKAVCDLHSHCASLVSF